MEVKTSGYFILLSQEEWDYLSVHNPRLLSQAVDYGMERLESPLEDYAVRLYHQPMRIVDEVTAILKP
jgi:hypothetical protein